MDNPGIKLRALDARPRRAICGPPPRRVDRYAARFSHRAAAPASQSKAKRVTRGRRLRRLLAIAALATLAAAIAAVLVVRHEARTSRLQADYFAERAARLDYGVAPGQAAEAVHFPDVGPYNVRMGYARLPSMLERLGERGFAVTHQARVSPAMAALLDAGLFPIYREKSQAGFVLRDAGGKVLYGFRYPQHQYARFEDIPQVLVTTLLFIEDRNLLGDVPTRNPAVDPRRLGRAVLDKVLTTLGSERDVPGGSTLATQMEKFRHSPSGRTSSADEKIRQMLSASFRAYLDGPDTRRSSRRIVRDYINSVPLGARAGWGEVHGVGDGLWVWFGADFDEVNALLREDVSKDADPQRFAARAHAFRQVLSLVLAQQRPAVFLPGNLEALNERTEKFLRRLAIEGLISPELRDAALARPVTLASDAPTPRVEGGQPKYVASEQAELVGLLGLDGTYALDRLDLDVQTTLDARAQERAAAILDRLDDRSFLREHGLQGGQGVGRGDPGEIVFSFVLYERGADANRVRVRVDTHEGAFDLNRSARLDLGSTAKLRTLVHYLEIIAALHDELAGQSPEALRAREIPRGDALTRWAARYLQRRPDASLEAMLEAAMGRTYAGDPDERFMTGGGRHVFGNIASSHDERVFTVRSALRASGNLPFVRLMRDLVNYHVHRLPGDPAAMLRDPNDPRRAGLIARYAEVDGRRQIHHFYDRYRGLDEAAALARATRGLRLTPERLAHVYRGVAPGRTEAEFAANLRRTLGRTLPAERTRALYERFAPGKVEIGARDAMNTVNPLEVWVAGYLQAHPEATRAEVLRASAPVRAEALEWLQWPHDRRSQDIRIGYVLEEQAFERIHAAWARTGYPFARLVPSLATALGSSADRPEALSTLIGILLADGKRLPTVGYERLHFAADTPFETAVAPAPDAPVQVLRPEVARQARREMLGVVQRGTAQPLRRGFVNSAGERIEVGGKTGTGDNRHFFYDRNNRVVGHRTVNRTATWMFSLGECFYGTIVAYVPGEEAGRHSFVSMLPVRLLAVLEPAFEHLLERANACDEAGADVDAATAEGTRAGAVSIDPGGPGRDEHE